MTESGMCWAMRESTSDKVLEELAVSVSTCNETDVAKFLDYLGRGLERKYGPSLEEALDHISDGTGWYGSTLIQELHKRLF